MDFPVLGTLVQVFTDMGALGVAAIVIWGLMTERLVPRGRLDERAKDLDKVEVDAKTERREANAAFEKQAHRLDRLTDVHERAVQLMGEALKQRRP